MQYKILVVDASPTNRQIVRDALQGPDTANDDARADVVEADSLAAGRAAFDQNDFACLLVAESLPDGGAIDLLREVMALNDPPPVIILSAVCDAPAVQELVAAGAADCLPEIAITANSVIRTVRTAMRFHQAQRETRAALRVLHIRNRAIEAAADGVVIADPYQPDCPLIYANPAFYRLTGYAPDDVIGRNCRFLQGTGTDDAAVQELRDAIRSERDCLVPLLNYRKDGTPFWNELTLSPVRDSGGKLTHFVGIQSDISERRALEAERERFLAEAQARADQESLVNSIGQSIRSAVEPEQILQFALAGLAQALGADRCYFATYDEVSDRATIDPEWHRAGLPTMVGDYSTSRFSINLDPDYQAGRTQAIPDTANDPSVLEVGLRALLRVPLVSGPGRTSLVAAMVDAPRIWTSNDISLIEAIATQTQSALESVRVHRREHRIAEQLQAALQPPLPDGVAGLALVKYYEAALAEAGVGGDFYDAFSVDKGCTILVVGDLSGKGLAAAAQVSTVRNMLRAFLYSQPTLAGALTDLNRVLALNGLLTGFATLFVGAYDQSTGELSYVNCGQEPALVRRADGGHIEELLPTGPVLGALENAVYDERSLTLKKADALAIFTDGVTECGATRTQMLGIDGVAALLRQPLSIMSRQVAAPESSADAHSLAEAVAAQVIGGVKDASPSGIAHDDVCLLVAVVQN